MLSISTIARVIVNASRAVSVPTSFDTQTAADQGQQFHRAEAAEDL